MSLTHCEEFMCPYCMAFNDFEIDTINDVGQILIVDCHNCCRPIDIMVKQAPDHAQCVFEVQVKRDDEQF